MIKLSVIIPGYNTRKEWWVRCVRSVAIAAAKAGEYEIVCIDDGSKTPVQQGWFAGIDGVRVIREENKGLPTARNLGMDQSTGEFLTFVDSDDEVLPDAYVKTLEAMARTGADVGVFGVNSRFTGEGYQVLDLPPDHYYGALRPEDVGYLVHRRLFYYSCNKIFRRAFFAEHGLRFNPEGVPCEDAIFNVGLVVNKAKWVTVPFVGYVYYRYDGTICSNYKPTYVAGTRACTKAWHDYKATTPGAYEGLEKYGLGWYDETSEADIVRGQWLNIWRPRSPYGLAARWRYARENCDVLGRCTPLVFGKMSLVMFVRRYLYVKPIRRWYQKRGMIRIGAKVEPLAVVSG